MDAPNDAPAPAADEPRRRLSRRLFFGLPLLAGAIAARPSVAQAGTSTSTWKMEGNSDVDDNDFLGSKNDKSLVFKTNNVERARITNAGRVGIGTASPQNTLHVVAINNGVTGIRGDTSSTDARATGVLGQVTAATPGLTAAGVKGFISAVSNDSSVRLSGYGVWGLHYGNGVGVCGEVEFAGTGVLGRAFSDGQGVGVSGYGGSIGVSGSTSRGGTGVRGEASYIGAVGVSGNADGPGSTGVFAKAQDSESSTFSADVIGVKVECDNGVGVQVRAIGEDTVGVYTFGSSGVVASGDVAVQGFGSGGVGVLGVSDTLTGYTFEFLEDRWNKAKVDAFLATRYVGEDENGIGVLGIGESVGVMGHGTWASGIGVAGIAPDADYNGFGIYGKSSSNAESFAGYFDGPVTVNGALRVGAGSSAQHVVTSPQAVSGISGNVSLNGSGAATVTLPAGSPALTDVRYQLTPVGGAMPNLHVAQVLANGAFGIAGGTAGLTVSWRIEGVR